MRAESFTGWRVWRVVDWQEGTLGGAVYPYVWEGPVLALPASGLAELPSGGGYHAFRTWEQASCYGCHRRAGAFPDPFNQGPRDPSSPFAWAIGRVELYGTVVEYEHGFRASHAIVREVRIAPEWSEEFAARLSHRYQCPVGRWGHPEPPNVPALPAPVVEPALSPPPRWDWAHWGSCTRRLVVFQIVSGALGLGVAASSAWAGALMDRIGLLGIGCVIVGLAYRSFRYETSYNSEY